jgi:hypothetical protein
VTDTKPARAPVIAPGRAGTAERAIARCIETLSALVPQVDAELAGAAIMRVASRTESRNMITNYLFAHPTALVDGDSGAPGPLAHLIEDLIASGVAGLQPPRCLDCGEPKPLVRRVPGGRVCNRCRHRRRPLEACARCGTIARRATRDADGHPICGRCHQLTYVSAPTGPTSGSATTAQSSRTPPAWRAGCQPRSRSTRPTRAARTARRERASRAVSVVS